MCMHEGNLAAFFYEEETIGYQMLEPGHDLSKLKMRTKEIKENIQEDIIKLLDKRRTLMAREMEMGELGKDLSSIIDKQNIANSFMETICNLWIAATEAGNLMWSRGEQSAALATATDSKLRLSQTAQSTATDSKLQQNQGSVKRIEVRIEAHRTLTELTVTNRRPLLRIEALVPLPPTKNTKQTCTFRD
ncbi:hypothetical protein P8452_52194 [Trifolium repens]|nr:hypothetical protein P8452_52194 [Trifolium repens]